MTKATWIIGGIVAVAGIVVVAWLVSIPRTPAPDRLTQAKMAPAAPAPVAAKDTRVALAQPGAAFEHPESLCGTLTVVGMPAVTPWRVSATNPSVTECYSDDIRIGSGTPASSITYAVRSRAAERAEIAEVIVRIGRADAVPEAVDRLGRAALQLLSALGTRAPDGLLADIAARRGASYDLGFGRALFEVGDGVAHDLRFAVTAP